MRKTDLGKKFWFPNIWASISAIALVFSLHEPMLASESGTSAPVDLRHPRSIPNDAVLLTNRNTEFAGTQSVGDTYSLAPTIGTTTEDYYLSTLNSPTTHTFDGYTEFGGEKYCGTTNAYISVDERILDLGSGVSRYLVQVSAFDTSQQLEPWVDGSCTGNGFTQWRLDVGSDYGGIDRIDFDSPVIVLGSGLLAYDSTAALIGEYPIADTSTSTSLSGWQYLDLGGEDIAGFDVAAMQMYWDVVIPEPEIRIRPLVLDFDESVEILSNELTGFEAQVTPLEVTQQILPELKAKAQRDGQVRVIIGIDVAFQPEGRLRASERLTQRQEIQDRFAELLASLQGLQFHENRRFQFIPYIALSVDHSALEYLERSPIVTSIEEDALSFPSLASSNEVIGSPLAWAEGYDGSGQTIAILDSGLDKTHPWFTDGKNKVVSEACYSTTDGIATSVCPGGVTSSTASGSGINCDLSISGCDHGTHVAGIAAGNPAIGPDFGVARGADLVAIQVFSRIDDVATCSPDPSPCSRSTVSDQIRALERVYELRNTYVFAAVNMSLGGGQFSDQASCDAANTSRKAAIDNLRSVNIATVISSGNDGWKNSISAPACISSAISVSATDDSDEVASFSNIYPQIHLLAPGADISSSVPGGGTASKFGTSMAAPHVAGAWGVLKQRNPAAGVDDILATLQNTGTIVDDLRIGGVETDMPRINVDLALGEPRTTFGIFNDGSAPLSISSIIPATNAPWISWTPATPFDVEPGELQVVNVFVDFGAAPGGQSQTRLLINSNDSDESPYPEGVYVNVSTEGFSCSGTTVLIENHTFDGNTSCTATNTLTAETNVIINSGVVVDFISPVVSLGPDFTVEEGAILNINATP